MSKTETSFSYGVLAVTIVYLIWLFHTVFYFLSIISFLPKIGGIMKHFYEYIREICILFECCQRCCR